MSKDYQVKTGEYCAFPWTGLSGSEPGLTKREYFAVMAMQAVIPQHITKGHLDDGRRTAEVAVQYADALLEELERKK
jgi:hypothetical protein